MSEAIAVREEVNVFALFDKLDDEIILAELENRIIDHWIYHFNRQGKDIWELSKKGVDQSLAELEKAGYMFEELPDIKISKDLFNPDTINVIAQVRKYRYTSNGQKYEMGVFTGSKAQKVTDDPFYFEKAIAKAYRNAKSRCIPEEMKAKIIALAKSKGKVKTVEEEPEADGLITEHRTEASSHLATDKQKGWIKGLVKEKLDDDWADFCVRFKFQTKQEAFDTMTVKMASSIIETLKSMKSIKERA